MARTLISKSGLVGYWKLDEASGTRSPKLGSSSFSENGTVGRRATSLSYGAEFSANSANYLSSTANPSKAGGLWVVAVVTPDTIHSGTIVSSYSAVANGHFVLRLSSGGEMAFLVSDGSALIGSGITGQITATQEHIIQGWLRWNGTNWTTVVRVGGNQRKEGSTLAAPIGAGTSTLMIGRRQEAGNPQAFDGVISQVAIWEREPTWQEVDAAYRRLSSGKNLFEDFNEYIFVSGGITTGATARVEAPHENKCMLGVALDGTDITQSQIDAAATLLGARPNFIQFYKAFPPLNDINRAFPAANFTLCRNYGAIPVFTWEPFYFPTATKVHISLEEIQAGSWDQHMRNYCDGFMAYGGHIIIRLMHEHNLPTTYWWAENDVANIDANTPGRYITMFRHIVTFCRDYITSKGGDHTKLLWAWCPNNEPVPNLGTYPWNTIAGSYPGDEYVDIVGLDGYDWGTMFGGSARTFNETFASAYAEVRAVNADAPFIVFETNVKHSTTDPVSDSYYNFWWDNAFTEMNRLNMAGVCLFYVPSKNQQIYTPVFGRTTSGYVDNSNRTNDSGLLAVF